MSKEHVEAVSEFAAGIIKDQKKQIEDLKLENSKIKDKIEQLKKEVEYYESQMSRDSDFRPYKG